LQDYDADQKVIIQKVDVKTGKSTIVPPVKTELELLRESLPGDISLGTENIVSDDYRSVIFNRDNDRYFFAAGDRELIRLSYDNVPEVSTRF
jgi:hypothetical protein